MATAQITNFQSLKSAKLTLGGLTVLVGESDLGKSAVIRALEAALFGLPGSDFIRYGAKEASVTLAGLPGLAEVTWSRGKKVAWTVGSERYETGGKIPEPLEQAGYRDVWVGDQDRKRGEWIRPQVGDQFDPLFLLKRTGSHVADVLTSVSRVSVVQMAVGRCAADAKAESKKVGAAEEELRRVLMVRDALTPLADLRGRVDRLDKMRKAWHQLADIVAQGEAARGRRVHALGVLAHSLPAATPALGELGRSWLQAHALVTARKHVQQAARVVLPPETSRALLEEAGRVIQAQALAVARGPVQRAVRVVLPSETSRALLEEADRVVQVQRLVHQRARLAHVSAVLPPATVVPFVGYGKALDLAATFERSCQQLRQMLPQVRMAEAAFAEAETDHSQAERSIADLLASCPVCPVCERTMP